MFHLRVKGNIPTYPYHPYRRQENRADPYDFPQMIRIQLRSAASIHGSDQTPVAPNLRDEVARESGEP